MTKTKTTAAVLALCVLAALTTVRVGHAQVVARQVVDKDGAPQYRVDPFWPNPLPTGGACSR